MSFLVITGTNTGVGKTVATAALACHARVAGRPVTVCKPVQTGTADGDDDLAEIGRLAGVTDLVGVARYPQPLAPVAAAAEARLPLPSGSACRCRRRAGRPCPAQNTLVRRSCMYEPCLALRERSVSRYCRFSAASITGCATMPQGKAL